MAELTNKIITYKELHNFSVDNDQFQIASYMTEVRIKTFLNNPLLQNEDDCAMNLSLYDNIPIGRLMLFPSRIKADAQVFATESGSALEVHPNYRKYAVGADLMIYWTTKESYDFIVVAGISDMALPMYKKLKFHIFEYPRLMMLRNSRSLLESKGLHGVLLKMGSPVANVLLKCLVFTGFSKSDKLSKKFKVVKETIIPDWVDDIVLNDGHKYMEVHDRTWLQWNLDYNFHGLKRDIQSFYTVYASDGKPVAFFMTKERFREVAAGQLKNIVIGSVVEWGTKDAGVIDEADLTTLALRTFSKDVDIIETATDNENSVNKLCKRGFLKHGFAHIALRDKRRQMPKDFADQKNWRIRYGYGDVILT